MSSVGLARLRDLLGAGRAGEAATATDRRIFGTIGLQLVGRGLGIAVSLATVPLIARTLGTTAFGVWVTAVAYVGLFSILTEFGLPSAATLRMSAEPEREAEWLGAMSSLRTLMTLPALALCLAGIPVALTAAGDVRLVALIVAASVVTVSAGSLMAVFQTRLRGGLPLGISIVQSALWLTVVGIVAALSGSVVALAVGFTGVSVVVAALQVRAVRRLARPRWRGTSRRWGQLMRVALPIGLAGVFVTVSYRVDAVLLYGLSGAEEAGVYGVAYRFLDPLVLLPAAVMAAFTPAIAAGASVDRARVKHLVQLCADAMALLSLPAVAVTLVLSGPIVRALFGDAYARSAGLLPILMGAFVAVCYGNLAGYLAPVLGLQWRIALYAFAGAVVNVLLNLVLIPRHGAYGSAWATLLAEGVTMSLLLVTDLRALRLRLAVRRIVLAALAAAVMTAVMTGLSPLGLLPALAGGGLSYAAALVMLGAVPRSELRRLVGAEHRRGPDRL